MIFLKEFFEKVDFENNKQTTKKHYKLPRRQRIKSNVFTNEMIYHIWPKKHNVPETFSNFLPSLEDSVDPDQLASSEASW